MKPFSPEAAESCAPAWKAYKREFLIHLDSSGLYEKPGRRQVGALLKCMGMDAIRTYDTFDWSPAVEAVAEDADAGIVAVEARAAEDQYDLDTVFHKFDQHFGVRSFRSMKRQAFLDIKRKKDQSIMDFVAELKREAELCEYGDLKESLICDKLINSVDDSRCSERLLELADHELTLGRVVQICRQTELTRAHMKTLEEKTEKDVHVARSSDSRGRGRARGYGRGRRENNDGNSERVRESCDRCCRRHEPNRCSAYNRQCDACGERGHYRRSPMCKFNKRDDRRDMQDDRQHDRPVDRYDNRQSNRYDNRQSDRYDNNRQRYEQRNGYDNRQTYRPSDSYGDRRNDRQGQGQYSQQSDRQGQGQYRQQSDRQGQGQYRQQSDRDRQDRHVHYADDDYYDDGVTELFDDLNVVDAKVAIVYDINDVDGEMQSVNVNSCRVNDEWVVQMHIHDFVVPFEIDTGAGCNIISMQTVANLGCQNEMKKSSKIVKGVHGEAKQAVGVLSLPCIYKDVVKCVDFQVFDGPKKLDLLGRADCVAFGLIARVNVATIPDGAMSQEQIMREFSDVVSESIGCMPGEYRIKIDESVQPVVHSSRPLPVPLREKVKTELASLEKNNIIAKVDHPTPWVSSMVVVRKKNTERVRICIDPTDLNTAIKREHFPMNNFDDVVTRLAGSKVFSTLDANMGYYQMKIDPDSSDLTTFNTPFGRYKYLRMPMGLKCASEVFQREMVRQFGELDGVEVVVDDLLVHGRTEAEHNQRLMKVMEKARQIDLKLNKNKCRIGLSEVNYVGHLITGDGLKPTDERVKAITSMPEPKDVHELETLLGMIAYVSKFIPNLSELNHPLRAVKKKEEWQWGDEESRALNNIKTALTSAPVLKFYDVTKPVTISVDASMKGLGAAIIQENAVVAYASRTLTDTETRYAQIEKEMLAVVFGCTKFHKLIYGKEDVTIESDHKPLESLLKKPMHISPMRIQRMRLKLQPYSFRIIHISGKNIGLADCLSRFPQAATSSDERMDDDLMVCIADTTTQRIHHRVREETSKDEELTELKKLILFGWEKKSYISNLYNDYQSELSTYNGVVYRGNRVVVPKSMRPEMLKTLHSSHQGIVKTKQRARDVIFWPGMNKQIEETVKKCAVCLQHQNKPQKEPLIPHEVPKLPWNKVATDLFELDGDHYLVMVDYYSNFIEAAQLPDTKTSTVLREVKGNIARHGVMETLVSDNGPQYRSEAFEKCMKTCGIKHITSSPLYPQSNGLAEKAVQTVKKTIKKCQAAGEDWYLALLDVNNTPRDDEMGSPAQRLMGRRTRTRMPTTEALLKPVTIDPNTVHEHHGNYRQTQKTYYDRGARERSQLESSDAVRILTPRGWQPAQYLRQAETPRSVVVRAGEQGREYRRNRSHVQRTAEKPHEISRNPVRHYVPPPPPVPSERPIQRHVREPVAETNNIPAIPNPTTTRSGRVLRRPAYLNDYVP